MRPLFLPRRIFRVLKLAPIGDLDFFTPDRPKIDRLFLLIIKL